MMQLRKSTILITIICFIILIITGCSAITNLAGIKEPEFKVSNVKLSNISFDKADLMLEVNVHNPNKIPLDFAGFDYNFFINKSSFVKGKQKIEQKIKANGNSYFKVPIELDYKNLYTTFNNLTEKDVIDYNILLGFDFNFPVVGKTSFPIKNKGRLPLPKIPTIEFDDFKLDSLSFLGADLKLDLTIENPNNFDLILNSFNYDLNMDRKTWAKSTMNKKTKILKKQKAILSIPVSLKFLTMGKSVYKAIASDKPLEYKLIGAMNLDTSLPTMKNLVMPINRTGKINILR